MSLLCIAVIAVCTDCIQYDIVCEKKTNRIIIVAAVVIFAVFVIVVVIAIVICTTIRITFCSSFCFALLSAVGSCRMSQPVGRIVG